jgi:hypothetical protein
MQPLMSFDSNPSPCNHVATSQARLAAGTGASRWFRVPRSAHWPPSGSPHPPPLTAASAALDTPSGLRARRAQESNQAGRASRLSVERHIVSEVLWKTQELLTTLLKS